MGIVLPDCADVVASGSSRCIISSVCKLSIRSKQSLNRFSDCLSGSSCIVSDIGLSVHCLSEGSDCVIGLGSGIEITQSSHLALFRPENRLEYGRGMRSGSGSSYRVSHCRKLALSSDGSFIWGLDSLSSENCLSATGFLITCEPFLKASIND